MAIKTNNIKKNIIDQLYWDDRVVASDIDVNVMDGEVELVGTVPTYGARLAAEADAVVVPGVRNVANNLNVKYPATDVMPTDDEITSNIENVFNWNNNLDLSSMKVYTEQGSVNLEGSVTSIWRKILAEDLALSVKGVVNVKNKLSVVPGKDVVDEVVAEDIVNALDRNQMINVEDVDVKVDNGIVTLTGTVSDWHTRLQVYNTALYTRGVIDIRDQLVIKIV